MSTILWYVLASPGGRRGALITGAVVGSAALFPIAGYTQALPPRSSVPDSTIVRLSLLDTRALALKQHPGLLVARQRPDIARGELRQARAIRFNPDLSFLARADPELTLTQEIEWAGQRRARSRAARHELARTRFEAGNVGRLALTDASLMYYRTLAAQRRREVVEQVQTLTERLIAAVRVQLAEGELSTLDANLAEIEHGRIRARAAAARRELQMAEFELKRVLGLSPAVALRLENSAPTTDFQMGTDSLTEVALRTRPDLREAASDIETSRARQSLARREVWPNIRVGVVAEPGVRSGNRIGFAGGISLPALNGKRGAIDARAAEVRLAELRARAIEAAVRTDVRSAIARLQAATEELQQYEESVLLPARSTAGLLGEAYRAGKIPLPTLLLLRNQLLDAEFGYWEAWLIRHESAVQLESATGTLTPPEFSELPATNSPS